LVSVIFANLTRKRLGVDVVVVEDEPHAQRDEREGDEEQEVGGIAGLDRVERVAAVDLDREAELVVEGGAVLARVVLGGLLLVAGRERVAVDPHALELFVFGGVPLEHGADNGHAVAGGAERAGLLPDAPVEGQREVLDEDEDVFGTSHGSSTSHVTRTGETPVSRLTSRCQHNGDRLS
jgi:hypothetical protein